MMIAIRVRSAVWFATGAVLALFVSLLVLDAIRADAAPGDTDSTFVPITSCRLIDTRPPPDRVGPVGTWGIKETKSLQATGTNGKCTIPADAVGLTMNVTALNATADGFLTFWASGALPLAASLNPSPGQPPIPNAVSTELSATGSFNVYNENGTVDIIIDVNGYYTKSSLQEIDTRLTSLERGTSASVVTDSGGSFTSSQTFVDIPNATTTATTVANGRLLITFSTEAHCDDTGVAPTTAWCQVEVLVDGTAVSPSPVIYQSGRAASSGESLWETASHQFVSGPLSAGSHTVQVRYRIDETPGTFDVDFWTLSVLPLRP